MTDPVQYGSDRAGLVYAYGFEPHQRGRAIDSDAAAEWLARAAHDDAGFLWLHFSLANAASEHWLRDHVALPDAFFELLTEGASTRVEAIDDALLAIFNDVQFSRRRPRRRPPSSSTSLPTSRSAPGRPPCAPSIACAVP